MEAQVERPMNINGSICTEWGWKFWYPLALALATNVSIPTRDSKGTTKQNMQRVGRLNNITIIVAYIIYFVPMY